MVGCRWKPPSFQLKLKVSILTMLHLSDSDGSDHDEMLNFRYESDPFNTLPDEVVLKIIKMMLNNRVAEDQENPRLRGSRFNFLVKVVSNISPRYVVMLFHQLSKLISFTNVIGSSSWPAISHFGEVTWQ